MLTAEVVDTGRTAQSFCKSTIKATCCAASLRLSFS
jgi:hypothetical protein